MERKKKWWNYKVEKEMSESTSMEIINDAMADMNEMKKKMGKFYSNCSEFEVLYQKRSYSNLTEKSHLDQDENSYPFTVNDKTPTYNVIKMNVDTSFNKISKIEPKPTFLTKGKDSEKRAMAKKLESYVLQQFKRGKVFRVGRSAFKDGCLSDLGIVKIYIEKKQAKFRKIHPRKFFCSNPYAGENHTNYCGEFDNYKVYDLYDMFPESKEMLQKKYKNEEDSVEIYELFKAGKKKIIFTRDMILYFGNWKHDFVPYEFSVWSEATEGVIGMGQANEILSLHNQINFMLSKISKSARLISSPKIAYPKGSQITESQINNEIGSIYEYAGDRPPTVLTPPIFNEQYFNFVEVLYNKSINNTGTSVISASGRVPEGVRGASGQALRSYQDINSERFAVIIRNYQDLYLRIAKKMILLNPPKEIELFSDGRDIKEILDTDMQIYAANILPEEPAGQLQTLSEFMQMGIINPEEALSLLDSPDIRKFTKSKSSRIDAIELMIEEHLDNEKEIVIDEFLGIDLQLEIARRKYSELLIERKPKENERKILVLTQFINAIVDRIRKEQEEQRMADIQRQLALQGGGAPQGQTPQQGGEGVGPLPPSVIGAVNE